ncbi:MAG: fucose isomerase, partial [Terriglobus sp.]
EDGAMHVDIGLAKVTTLPADETEARWNEVTKQWPMVSVVTEGVGRDGFMARHRANHVSIAYTGSRDEALKALATKAAMCSALGITVHLCGVHV